MGTFILVLVILCVCVAGEPECSLQQTSLTASHQGVSQQLIQFIDHLNSQSSVPLLGRMLSIERHPEKQEVAVSRGHLSDHIDHYLRSHVLRLYLPSLTFRHVDLNLDVFAPSQGRSKKIRRLLFPLMLALQVKTLLALPLLLLVSAFLGLQSLGTSILAALFSGAALLRSFMSGNNRGSGASSRVSYEVKQPPASQYAATPTLHTAALQTPDASLYPYAAPVPYYIPPTGLARGPEYKIFSSASNDRRK
ncbi:hypothetical protein B566_EDAN007897 [Ephemera danica]|nr:hypothetical protein B566_EDAN007897 [Ephemera danica]